MICNIAFDIYLLRVFLYFHISRYITMNCSCKNNPNWFCYICGHVALSKRRADIMDSMKTYYAYFGFKIGHYLKPFAPQI